MSQPSGLVAITGSTRPYIFDLPLLLSLPTDFEFRFRYRHQWVEPAVRNAEASWGDRELFLYFHCVDTGTLIPIRRGTVIKLESIGPMLFLRFRAGELVGPEVDLKEVFGTPLKEMIDQRRASLTAEAREHTGITASLNDLLPNGSYLFSPSVQASGIWSTGSKISSADRWAHLVALLQPSPSLLGIPFFHILGFEREDATLVPSKAIRNRCAMRSLQKVHGYELIEGDRYRLRIAQWAEPPSERLQAARVECVFDTASLRLEGSSGRVVGRYDILEYAVRALVSSEFEVALRAEPLPVGEVAPPKEDGDSKVPAAVDPEAMVTNGEGVLEPPPKQVGGSKVPAVVDPGGMATNGESVAWDSWPTTFVARIPVKVRWNRALTALRAGLFLLAAVVYWQAPAGGDTRELIRVGATLVMFALGKDLADRLLKSREHTQRLAQEEDRLAGLHKKP